MPERQEQVKPNQLNYIPYTGVINFVGRHTELAILHRKLQKSGMVAITAVAGMGGVGKTELAVRYAKNNEACYPGGICWFSARESNLAAKIIQFAQLYTKLEVPQDLGGKPLDIKQQVEWCWQNWQPASGLTLIVLDDVTDVSSCRELLPKLNRFRILITTRLRSIDSSVVEEISLDVLEPESALQLLTALVGKKRVQRELQTAKELCQWLGYLPLGLQLVGVYLAKKPPNWSLAKILQRLKEQKLQNEALNPSQQQLQQSLNTAQRGVVAAFELSWQELSPMTHHVAKLLSLFAPNDFLWEWVKSASQKLSWTEFDIETANEQLYQHHLIQWVEEKEGYFRIHLLIREFIQGKSVSSSFPSRINSIEELNVNYQQAFSAAMVAIAKEIPEDPTYEFITSIQDAIPHLVEVAQNWIDAVKSEDVFWLFTGLGRYYLGQGLYTLAEPWYTKCLSNVKARLGEEHPHFLDSLNSLAIIYKLLGNYIESEKLCLQALNLRQSLLGEENVDFADSLNELAQIYYSQGRYSEAEPLFLQALNLKKHLLGEEDPKVAITLNNLALLYDSLGRYVDAESLYLQVLVLRTRLLGEDHSKVAITLNNLALLYYHQDRYNEAEHFSLRALKIDQQFLGEDNPDFATDLHNLALIYCAQNRYKEAETLLFQVLEIKQRSLPEMHPLVTDTIYALGKLYKKMGYYTKAEPLCIKALELDRSLLGEQHSAFAISLNNLAELYYLLGRYTEAQSLYIQALEILEQSLGINHPDTNLCRNNLELLHSVISSN